MYATLCFRRPRAISVPSASRRCSQKTRNWPSQASTSAIGPASSVYRRRGRRVGRGEAALPQHAQLHRHRRLPDPELRRDHLGHLARASSPSASSSRMRDAPGRRGRRRLPCSARRRCRVGRRAALGGSSRGVGVGAEGDAHLGPCALAPRMNVAKEAAPRARPSTRRPRRGRCRGRAGARRGPSAPSPSRCRPRRVRTGPTCLGRWAGVVQPQQRAAVGLVEGDLDPADLAANSQVIVSAVGGSQSRISPPALLSTWNRPPSRRSPETGASQRGTRSGVGQRVRDLVGRGLVRTLCGQRVHLLSVAVCGGPAAYDGLRAARGGVTGIVDSSE